MVLIGLAYINTKARVLHSMDTLLYRQKSGQGCLAICLAYVGGLKPTLHYERNMILEGLFAFRENYGLSMAMAFMKRHGDEYANLHMVLASKPYTSYLVLNSTNSTISVQSGSILQFIQFGWPMPYIINIDMHTLGWHEHQPHHIVVLGRTAKMLKIMDPWTGQTRRVSRAKLAAATRSLKYYIGICPTVIWLQDKE
jgi:hypothetical protein